MKITKFTPPPLNVIRRFPFRSPFQADRSLIKDPSYSAIHVTPEELAKADQRPQRLIKTQSNTKFVLIRVHPPALSPPNGPALNLSKGWFQTTIARFALSLGVAGLLLGASTLRAADREQERILNRTEKLAVSIRNVQAQERSRIPASVMSEAKGVIILKQYEAGVIFGAKGGFGLAIRRNPDQSWGPPAWVKTGEISGGLQLGAQKLYVILLIMNEDSLNRLAKPRFQIGVDATVTRGPTGSNYVFRIGESADILAYTDYEGYYAGATFDGSLLLPDRKSNDTTYGERLEVGEILSSPELEIPPFLQDIITQLEAIETSSPTP